MTLIEDQLRQFGYSGEDTSDPVMEATKKLDISFEEALDRSLKEFDQWDGHEYPDYQKKETLRPMEEEETPQDFEGRISRAELLHHISRAETEEMLAFHMAFRRGVRTQSF